MMGAYRDFAALTAEALDFAAARCGGIDADTRARLLSAYDTLDAFADVAPTLRALQTARGESWSSCPTARRPCWRAPCARQRAAGPARRVDVGRIGRRVQDGCARLPPRRRARYGVAPAEVSFQSSNRWDIAGAQNFGFRTVWINRTDAPDEYLDLRPAAVLDGLAGLLDLQD